MLSQNQFIHHVYFWLAKPESKEDHAALLAGLQALSKVPSIQQFHIGTPAATNRDVIETSYQFSWLCVFPTKEAQDEYQVDPIHLNFVKEGIDHKKMNTQQQITYTYKIMHPILLQCSLPRNPLKFWKDLDLAAPIFDFAESFGVTKYIERVNEPNMHQHMSL